jgi:hypothetical protein
MGPQMEIETLFEESLKGGKSVALWRRRESVERW